MARPFKTVPCPRCAKRFKRLNEHLKFCDKNIEEVTQPEVVEAPVVETPVEKAPPSVNKIKLKFRTAIWVQINGVTYQGTEIEIEDMLVASEIVRIAKEAYGWNVLV